MACFDIPQTLQRFLAAAGSRKEGGNTAAGGGSGSEGQEGVSREQQAPRRKAAREGCGKRHREAHAGRFIKKHPPRVSTAASGAGGGTAETRPQPLAGQQRASQPPAGLQPSATSSTAERSSRTPGVWLAFFFFFFSFFPPDSSRFPCSAGPAAPRWDGERGEHRDAAPDLHQGFAVRAERPCKAAPKHAPVSQHTARPTPAKQEKNPRALKHHPSVLPPPSGHQRPHWHPQPDHGTQETSRSPAAATRAPLTEVPRGHRGQGARCQQ